MRGAGRGLLTTVILAALIAGGLGLQKAGPRAEPSAPTAGPSSGWSVCPHGGGPGWETTLYLANPGTAPATVRLTSLGRRTPRPPVSKTVPAGTVSSVSVPSSQRDAATIVEWFGSRVAAGWVARAGGGDSGVAAESCGGGGRTWFAPDGSTVRGEHAFLVVTNPSAAEAVLSVVLFTSDLPPIRQSNWTNIQLPGFRSTVLDVGKQAPNEAAVAAEVDVSSGRVAVSSLGVSDPGGVRSAMATPSLSDRAILPVAAGAGQSEIVVVAPGQSDVRFAATLISGRPPQPAGGLGASTQGGRSAKSYPVITNGPSSVDLLTQDGAPVAAALRSRGAVDTAATGGTFGRATAWVVLPTVVGGAAHPGLVLVNPGSGTVQVSLHLLGAPGDQLPPDLAMTVAPNSATLVPSNFLLALPRAAVVVRATNGEVPMATRWRSVFPSLPPANLVGAPVAYHRFAARSRIAHGRRSTRPTTFRARRRAHRGGGRHRRALRRRRVRRISVRP